MQIRRGMALAGLGLALLLAGCREPAATAEPAPPMAQASPPSQAASAGTPRAAPEQPTATPIAGGELRVGLLGPTLSFEAGWPANAAAVAALRDLVWESLVAVDPTDGSLAPGLASEWHMAADGQSVEFVLREDVHWHTGESLTAGDVAATFAALGEQPQAGIWQISAALVQRAEALSESRVRVILREAGCGALAEIGRIPILPADSLKNAGRPAGTGPFRLQDSSDSGGVVTLERNPNYRQPAYLDQLQARYFATPDDLLAAWRAGEVQVAQFASDYSAPAAELGMGREYRIATDEAMCLLFNTTETPLDDPRVRRALALSLDEEALAQGAAPAGSVPLAAPLLPDHWALDEFAGAETSAVAADRAWIEAGWPRQGTQGWRTRADEPLALAVVTNGENSLRQATAAQVAGAFRQVGVQTEVHVVEWGILLDLLFRHDFDVAVLSWPMALDPDQRRYWRSTETVDGRGFNLSVWQSAEADRLLDQAALTNDCAVADRVGLYGDFWTLWMQERPAVALFSPQQQVWSAPEVGGLAPSPFAGLLGNAARWYRQDQQP